MLKVEKKVERTHLLVYQTSFSKIWISGHSDFEPLPGGPAPEINLEMDVSDPSQPRKAETPPPSYDDAVNQQWL